MSKLSKNNDAVEQPAADSSNTPIDNKAEAEKQKNLGNEEYKKKNWSGAIEYYSKAIELDSANASYYSNRAAAYLQLHKFEQAIADGERSVEVDPSFTKGYLRIASGYFQLGKFLQAKQAYEKALELEPNNPSATEEVKTVRRVEADLERAKELLDQKNDSTQAYLLLDQILKLAPESMSIKLLRAEAMLGLYKYNEVSSLISDILRKDANNADALYIRGRCMYYLGNNANGIKHFQEALRLDPDHQKSRIWLKKVRTIEDQKKAGNDAFSSGKYQEAYDLYSAAIALDPDNNSMNATLYSNRAAAAMKLKKYDVAVKDATKSIELNADGAIALKALLRRAACYMELEQYEEAVRDYEKAYEQDRSNKDVAAQLRQAKLELKKSKRKNYYKILGVSKDASESEIKRAYRMMALKYHPDKFQQNEETQNMTKEQAEAHFKEIGEAYSVLSDPKKKARYDSGQDLEEIEGMGGMGANVDVNEIFSMFFGGGFGGGPFGGGGRRGGGGFPGGMHFQF